MTTREELFKAAGIIKPDQGGPNLDAVTDQAYRLEEDYRWRNPRFRTTSFFASLFPGGEDEKRCARHALYKLMNIPETQPMKPQGRAITLVGKAVENQIVWRWGKLGVLLSVDTPKSQYDYIPQVNLRDPELWLSGAPDGVLDIRPRWKYVLPVDVKSKTTEVIKAMKKGERSYDPDHWKQVQCYLYLCRKWHKEMGWEKLELEPAIGGKIYYVSRENPRNTFEVWVPYDEKFVNAGIERLREWKGDFLAGRLPARPKEWKWTEQPCKWCDFKKACKADVKEGVDRLENSNTIALAKQFNPRYNVEAIQAEVRKRWNETEAA